MSDTRFSKDHEWVRLSGGIATVGITDHAQQALGDVVYVDLPEAGRAVDLGEACAIVESVKAASEIYAPLTGTITDRNEILIDDPALVNRAPLEEGWFFRLDITKPSEFDTLMDEAAYRAYLETLG